MRNDLNHFIILIACLLILSGCKSRKEITRTVTDQTRIERTQTAVDTSRTEISTQETLSRKADESEEIYTRTQHFDSLGNLQTIQEVWRRIGRTELALRERSGSYISLNGMGTVTSESDSSTVVTTEQVNSSVDSRPVQGIEWLWVIVGIGLLLFIIITFVIKK